jgi:hypothetical protein
MRGPPAHGHADTHNTHTTPTRTHIKENFIQYKKGDLLLSEGYSWDYNLKTMQVGVRIRQKTCTIFHINIHNYTSYTH